MGFESIPERSNGDRVYHSWWNDIRSALLNAFGMESKHATEFTFANNQTSWADVTGLTFDFPSSRSAIVTVDIMRRTDTASSEVRAIARLVLAWRPQDVAWEILSQSFDGDEDHGVEFQVVTTDTLGQVQYRSTSISGSNYYGLSKYKAEAING